MRPPRVLQRKKEAAELAKLMIKEEIHLPACYAKMKRTEEFNAFVREQEEEEGTGTLDRYLVRERRKRPRTRKLSAAVVATGPNQLLW